MGDVINARKLANDINRDSLELAGTLRGFRANFDGFIQSIKGEFAETATKADDDAIRDIKKAREAVADAVSALEKAAKAAKDWAGRI